MSNIPCKAGKGYIHFSHELASGCRICNPEISNREELTSERLRCLKAAANAYHFAKHCGKNIEEAKKVLLEAAENYGDAI